MESVFHSGDNQLAGGRYNSVTEQYVCFATHESVLDCELILVSKGILFNRVLGCYKGEQENAWIINRKDWHAIVNHALVSQQESILHLGKLDRTQSKDVRPGVLEYSAIQRVPEFIGYLWPVTEEYALTQDAWTRSFSTYFVAAFKEPTID
jgi:hypothetical protein